MTPLQKHIDTFTNYLSIEKNSSPLTVKSYRHYLNKFSVWFETEYKDLSIEQLDINIVRNYRTYLSTKNLFKVTQNYHIICLRSFLRFLLKNDIKTLEPSRIDLPKTESRSIKFLNIDQLNTLFALPDIKTEIGLRDRLIFELLFSTGLRVSELSRLNRADVMSDELSIKGKGSKIRIVFISEDAHAWIKKYLSERKDTATPLFIRYTRQSEEQRLSMRSIQRIVTDYVKLSGIPVKATAHTFRHSFATDLLSNGANLREVQEMLGHANISTTQIYTHVTNKQLRESYGKYHSKT